MTSPGTRDTTPLFSSPVRANTTGAFGMAQQNGGGARGTRTPQMLEYERQADERQREYERMQEERNRMLEAEDKMQQEQERIAQEEYEMRQYYEAEALKHAEETRIHQEEVRRHQQRVRDHQRRLQDHEASSEAFARVIAMPAKPGRDRQISVLPAPRKNSAALKGNGQAPAQFPG
ncbi:Reticulocyte-binding protein 2-like protein a [Lachnellula suecica]|uniref:Reticulocyte-binding protein 2-like protein a n=1 Tax=Lachnellula suecica TaxID=602035 RepID=A0A8T9CF49_9HELO|nr:Reticulocyte-binding protein 2-like protein a [Lachnellula suecica]